MNGRVYDYNLGRFLSVDPFIQSPGNSQSMNPYSYIMNNPLSGTDPSGYTSEPEKDQEESAEKTERVSVPGSRVKRKVTSTVTTGKDGKTTATVTSNGKTDNYTRGAKGGWSKDKAPSDLESNNDKNSELNISIPDKNSTDILINSINKQKNRSNEVGAVLLESNKTGTQRLKEGRDAGKGSREEFRFQFGIKKSEEIVALAHSRLNPEPNSGSRIRRGNNNGPSEQDVAAMNSAMAPLITVAPKVTTILYRKNGQNSLKVLRGDAKYLPRDLDKNNIVVVD